MRSQPVVSRKYRFSEDACTKAIELLLKSSGKKKATVALGGEDDGKRSKEIPPDGSIQR